MVRAFVIAGALLLAASVTPAQACHGWGYSGGWSGPCVTQSYYYVPSYGGSYYAGPSYYGSGYGYAVPSSYGYSYASPPYASYYAGPSDYCAPTVYYRWGGYRYRRWCR
jgi:hypothetical protein